MRNGFCNLSRYKVFITHLKGNLDGTLMKMLWDNFIFGSIFIFLCE